MKVPSSTEKRVAEILEQMKTALPEIRRQIEVYEKKVKTGRKMSIKDTVTSRNV